MLGVLRHDLMKYFHHAHNFLSVSSNVMVTVDADVLVAL